MKAKRLLSALVTVAMMVTMLVSFSAVASAETITPNVAVSFVEMTADEIAEIVDTTGIEATSGSKAYWLTIGLSDYGTVDCDAKASGKGNRKLNSVELQLTFPDAVANYLDMSSDVVENWWITDMGDLAVCGASQLGEANGEEKILKVGFEAVNATQAYPTAVDETSDALTIAKLPILVSATDSFTVETTSLMVLFSEWTAKTAVANQETYSFKASTLVAPATLTIGTGSGSVVVNPTIGAATANGTDGVAITGTDKKYDNAIAVTTTITPGSASEIGMYFVPAKVNDWAKAAKATYSGALGDGNVTLIAALKNIPRALQDTAFDMLSKAYAVVDGVEQYGDILTTTINFGSTGEVEVVE